MALAPIAEELERCGILTQTDAELLVPGREMSRIKLREIIDVVRVEGETGALADPTWGDMVDTVGGHLDSAIHDVLGSRTLTDLIDEIEPDK